MSTDVTFENLLEARIIATALTTGAMPELSPDDFDEEEYSLLWGLMQRDIAKHGQTDYLLLGDRLFQSGEGDYRAYLVELAKHAIPDSSRIGSYVDQLRNREDSHLITRTLSELTADSRTADNAATVQDEAIAALRAVGVRKRMEYLSMEQAVRKSTEELERLHTAQGMPGITTGFPKLDEKTGGWQKSDLALIAARPAVGKTSLLCNFVLAVDPACRIGIVSTEQPAVQIVNRLTAIAGTIQAWKFRNPRKFDADEWERLTPTTADLLKRNISIMDATRPTVGDMERVFRDSGIDLLFIDYVQRIAAPGAIYERVSAVACGLKDVARNMDIPVVALAQINRQGSKNAGMEHLKGSGDLEQEADEVLILEAGEASGSVTLTLEKNRHGPVGTIDLTFRAPYLQFREVGDDGYGRIRG